MNTNWSTPKTNIFAAINDLRKAKAAGQNSVLIKKANKDCAYPLKETKGDEDFRNYKFNVGYAASISSIMADPRLSEFEKELSTNYVNRYGTPEAVKQYYETRELSAANDRGIGVSHLVHIEDYLEYLKDTNQYQRERMYRRQYYPNHGDTTVHFFDFYRYNSGSRHAIRFPDKMVWVVATVGKNECINSNWLVNTTVGLLNFWLYPLKWIPKRTVLRMDKYRIVTFRIGSVQNGISVEFGLPKKFGFN